MRLHFLIEWMYTYQKLFSRLVHCASTPLSVTFNLYSVGFVPSSKWSSTDCLPSFPSDATTFIQSWVTRTETAKLTSVFWCSLCVTLDINYRISSSSSQIIRKSKSGYCGKSCAAMVYVILPYQIGRYPGRQPQSSSSRPFLPPINTNQEFLFVWFPSSIETIHQIREFSNITHQLSRNQSV